MQPQEDSSTGKRIRVCEYNSAAELLPVFYFLVPSHFCKPLRILLPQEHAFFFFNVIMASKTTQSIQALN